MKNKLTDLFSRKNKRILNMYCTAGYPQKESLPQVLTALQDNGADIIEVGIPYSDPVADGPVIQESNMKALQNGINLSLVLQQIKASKETTTAPLILMGYLNPVMQYGMEKFCADAADAGVSGIILPDLPMYEYEHLYRKLFEQHRLSFIFLITPHTSAERIKKADNLSSGFLYAVSSSSVTGGAADMTDKTAYFKRMAAMKLNNPILIGFGISNKQSFDTACEYSAGAIIGSAYIKALSQTDDIGAATKAFTGQFSAHQI